MGTEREQIIRENLDLARTAILAKLADPDAIPDKAIVIPISMLASSGNTLTPARWELLKVLRDHGEYAQLKDLAAAVGRGKHRVSKDVDVLAGLGLAHKHRHGRSMSIAPDLRQIVLA